MWLGTPKKVANFLDGGTPKKVVDVITDSNPQGMIDAFKDTDVKKVADVLKNTEIKTFSEVLQGTSHENVKDMLKNPSKDKVKKVLEKFGNTDGVEEVTTSEKTNKASVSDSSFLGTLMAILAFALTIVVGLFAFRHFSKRRHAGLLAVDNNSDACPINGGIVQSFANEGAARELQPGTVNGFIQLNA